ncbi:hypothetical protein A8C75_19960 [Marinobacterium aestuarii]|uniref:LysM domain-containing protein n=1 Tax=Marinobacterium aestuarii TaxID=1821621 RepID=A0A1A9F3R7_9GAMM|nr:LysM peptidoglycan-binding domain-containing protein [Marinobacterium aestuarii]ANG64518.1 hypothetical protein A8C75_19960 [Marinobacterium aestuarii]
MLSKKSRYQSTPHFTDPDIFPGLQTRPIGPSTGVIEHEVVEGDRLDQLAQHYYKDDRLWWRIVDANPEFTCPRSVLDKAMVGRVILIPRVGE